MPARFRVAAVIHLVFVLGVATASPCAAQTRVSLEELRRDLAVGDVISIVPKGGLPVAGRLMRVGSTDLDVRRKDKRPPGDRGPQDVTVPLIDIQSLERPRDSVKNGAAVGALVGAAAGGALFVSALVVDRNEVDEWGPGYAAGIAVVTGIGALIGWAVDAAHSKPHIRYEAPASRQPAVSVQPFYSRRSGIAIAVTFSR